MTYDTTGWRDVPVAHLEKSVTSRCHTRVRTFYCRARGLEIALVEITASWKGILLVGRRGRQHTISRSLSLWSSLTYSIIVEPKLCFSSEQAIETRC